MQMRFHKTFLQFHFILILMYEYNQIMRIYFSCFGFISTGHYNQLLGGLELNWLVYQNLDI